ncbi:receptor-like protein 9DC3 [Medicago truncatula]|uniref:Receptor-like protein n=2 Tax=Medicago truncatula TaxID=3880 RepID=G7J1U6_MEDTR|nr:receptor-like protein 9DC3 [Medicago truncatula]AES69318.1 receptor-like protein [Medicago truncatula]
MVWFLLFLHLFLFHFPSFSSSFNFSCHHYESSALLHFKSSFTINSEPAYSYFCDESRLLKTATWKNEIDCCSWDGVTCDTISGHVIGLNLGCEGLQGILNPNSTLFHLAYIQKLNLANNDFSGSYFHSKFGGFLSLTHLDLSHSYLKGEIPTQISHLCKLQSLHLSGSYQYNLVWKESTLKRLVQNATNLRELFLDDTDLSSLRPNSIALLFNQSSSLVTLNLAETRLSGKLKRSLLCLPGIQELDMSFNDELQGQLPELSCNTSLRILDLSNCQFHGEIPMSFSNLTHLTSLTLSYNYLNGSIPSSLLTLPRLTYLGLIYNELSGPIPNAFEISNNFQELVLSNNKIEGELPTSLSNLRHLIYLDVSYNSFSGQFPSSLFNLTHLVTLDCSHNKLDGPLPNKTTGLQKLTNLRLNDNLLNGTIPPSLLSLPFLLVLDLSNNQLTGNISAISSYSLEFLSLSNNRLQGNIPESIFNLANLSRLDLSSNNLSGVVNFQNISNLQHLKFLQLSDNSQLSVNFESSVNYSFFDLMELGLSSLSLTEFPNFSEKLPMLVYLDLSNNKISGSVPNWLHEVDFLRRLDLSYNLLTGDISLSICNASGLVFLSLAYNQMTGTIPQCLANLSYLEVLDLQMNKFHGTLPSNFSKESELETLNLYGNQLEGHIPKSLSLCKGLMFLNLGNNIIEDNFPHWLETLHYLKVLLLRDNKLHGIIVNPKIKHPFPDLTIFDISNNNFSGPLPKSYFKKFEAMMNVTELEYMRNRIWNGDGDGRNPYSSYYDSVIVATKGNKMKLVKIPNNFVIIDLSRNKFEGEIPKIIGELHAIIGLNLSHNRLTGHIPKSIGNLTYLESLDLSSNMLTDVIPLELTNLNSLEVLDLSNNRLVGEIPQGKQFNTFTNDSYEGNLDLCGLPLSKMCGPEQHSAPSANNFCSEEKFEFGWKPVAIGYGCGFVIGIGIGYYMFLIGKPRWLVMIFGGQPKRRVKRRTRMTRNQSSITNQNQNQMVQMS